MSYNLLNEKNVKKHKSYLALGSNLNNPLDQLKLALASIRKIPDIQIIKTSSIYWSKPLGSKNQPDFANQVILMHTSLTPHHLLEILQTIEREQGKRVLYHWGPRKIDIDILLYENSQIQSNTLCIPHPEIEKRDFVLLPLFELNPGLALPHHGATIAECLQQCVLSNVYALQPVIIEGTLNFESTILNE